MLRKTSGKTYQTGNSHSLSPGSSALGSDIGVGGLQALAAVYSVYIAHFPF